MSAALPDDTPRGPGRPRDEHIGRRVRAAARAEVAEKGSIDVTLASIARRAGVAKSTAYLRWPTVLDLLAEALIEVVDFGATPDTGTLRGDLRALARQVIDAAMVPPMLEMHMQFWAMGARAPETYRRFQRNDMALGVRRGRKVFEQARDRGEIPGDYDLDLATRSFMGALLMHALASPTHRPPTRKSVYGVVDLFVHAVQKPG